VEGSNSERYNIAGGAPMYTLKATAACTYVVYVHTYSKIRACETESKRERYREKTDRQRERKRGWRGGR